MEALSLRRIQADEALQQLQGLEALDPRGAMTPERLADLVAGNFCFAAEGPAGQAVYVLGVRDNHCQVLAAKGAGDADLTPVLLSLIEKQSERLDAVSFQTARPGLVRKARKQGYDVTGWILRKSMR